MKSNSENRDRDDVVGIVAHLIHLVIRNKTQRGPAELAAQISSDLCDLFSLDHEDVAEEARTQARAMLRPQ